MPFSCCRDVADRISQIVDGEAGPVVRARFFAHLAMCPPCKRYYEQLRVLSTACKKAVPKDLPADFEAVLGSILEAIDCKDSEPSCE